MSPRKAIEPHAVFESAIESLRKFHDAAQAALDAHRTDRPELGTLLQNTARLAQPTIIALKASRSLLIETTRVFGRLGSMQHDVLALIFDSWAQLPDSSGRNHQNAVIPLSYTAAGVNRHWRSVALATPSLWTRSTLNFDKISALQSYVETSLARSGLCPLHVDITNAQFGRRRGVTDALLATLFGRCRRLSLTWGAPKDFDLEFAWSLLQALQVSMPILEHLELTGLRSDYDIPPHTLLLTLCPRLRTLKMDHLPFSLIDPAAIPLLEHFACKSMLSGADIAALVAACPRIATLEISRIEAGTVVTIPRLSTLACGEADQIFRCITSAQHAPALQHLRLSPGPEMVETFTAFLESGPCTSLTALEIAHSNCASMYPDDPEAEEDNEPSRLLEQLPRLPNVTVLRLTRICSGELYNFLEAWHAQVRLAPDLRRLELRNCDLYDATSQLLIGFLAARKEAGLPLQDVEIVQEGEQGYTWSIFSTWMQPRIEQLVSGTVFVDVSTASVSSYLY